MRLTCRVLAAAALLAPLAALGTSAPAGARIESSTATISVTLQEWKVIPSAKIVRAGKVTFLVKNAGTIEHELVVLRTERHHHALPVKGGRAVEMGLQGEVEELEPGESARLTIALKPGKYVLLCNLLGHYKAGQFAALRAR